MKTLIIICALFFSGTSIPTHSVENSTTPVEVVSATDSEGPIITVKFDIGRKKKDCKKFGVCSVTIGVGLSLNDGNSGGGYAQNVNGVLQVEFMKSTMTVETMAKYFANDIFIVEENFDLPEDLIRELNLDKTDILTGIYEVQDLGESLRIRF